MSKSNLTQQQLNRIIEFRQAVHRRFLTRQRDAQFELVDALLLSRQVRSFPELSLSPVFRRGWSSVYTAVEDGQQDVGWLRGYLLKQVPTQERQIFSLAAAASADTA